MIDSDADLAEIARDSSHEYADEDRDAYGDKTNREGHP